MILNILNNLLNKEKMNLQESISDNEIINQRGYYLGFRYGWIDCVGIKEFSNSAPGGLPFKLHCYNNQNPKSALKNRIFFKTKEDAQKFIDEVWNKEYIKENKVEIIESRDNLTLVKINDKWNVYVMDLCIRKYEVDFDKIGVKINQSESFSLKDYFLNIYPNKFVTIYPDYKLNTKSVGSKTFEGEINLKNSNICSFIYKLNVCFELKVNKNKLSLSDLTIYFDLKNMEINITREDYIPVMHKFNWNNVSRCELIPFMENKLNFKNELELNNFKYSIDFYLDSFRCYADVNLINLPEYDSNDSDQYKKFISEVIKLIMDHLNALTSEKSKIIIKNFAQDMINKIKEEKDKLEKNYRKVKLSELN